MGWYLEHRRAEHEKTSIADLMVSGDESSDAVHAARAIKVIGLIGSGDTQDAVESLSRPIADYYVRYLNYADENQRRAKLRALIEDLIRTNMIVARVIKDRMELSIPTNEVKTPTTGVTVPKK